MLVSQKLGRMLLVVSLLISCRHKASKTDADGDGVMADVDCDDTSVDVGAAVDSYPDGDGDGHGMDTLPVSSCIAPAGYVVDNLSKDDRPTSQFGLVTILLDGGEARTVVSLIDKLSDETIREYGHAIASMLIQRGYPEPATPLLDRMEMRGLSDELRSKWRKQLFFLLSALGERPDARSWLERQSDYVPDTATPSPDPRTFTFGTDDIQSAKKVFGALNVQDKGAFRTKLETALWAGRVPDTERKEAMRALSQSTERWSPEECSIGTLVADGTGVLSHEFSRLLEFMEGRRSECVVEIHKTGSALFVYGRRHPKTGAREFTFANDITANGANAWKQAHETGIPVAPILRPSVERTDGSMRVYSRYCGKPIHSYLDNPGVPRPFRDWIAAEVTKTKRELVRLGVYHGHTHMGNFTVEFYRSELFDREIAAGKNANEIPYAPGDVTFDPIPYFEHPKDWMPVVRLIDWDQATSSRP